MVIEIPVPTFKTIVNIKISKSSKKLDRWNREILANFDYKEETFKLVGCSYDIYLKDGHRRADIVIDGNGLTLGVLVHELLHTVRWILKYVDIPFCDETEEVYTNLLDYLTDATVNDKKYKKIIKRYA